MMRNEVIPLADAEVDVRGRRGPAEDLVSGRVGQVGGADPGDVLELPLLGSGGVLQRLWPSHTTDLPPAA
jgi:hypothetical protein